MRNYHTYMPNTIIGILLFNRKGAYIMSKKIFILGMQSLTSSEDSLFRFGNDNELIIPFPEGLDELQKASQNYNEKGRIAKRVLDYLSTFKIQKLLSDEGVKQINGSIIRFEKDYQDEEIPTSIGILSKFNKRKVQIAIGMNKKFGRKVPVIIISKNPVLG